MSGESESESRASSRLVLGTAGHIDHGKTTLVRALTGRNLDSLPEEKARGITIELGFAPLELSDGMRLAIVDVPGHERFVRTMVAGASGLDLMLLVVAADEGVMPQTREHLAICELLGIRRGLVVLTKSDLVDEEMLELAGEEVRDMLADGPLAELPILSASAETGAGIPEIRTALENLIRTAPERDDDQRPARLFIDRTFTKRGFGTVVTGTWSGRPRRVGDSAVLEPGGRKVKIRGLERHGESVDEASSGSRIAVNLQGESRDEIHRGDLLTEPSVLAPTSSFDATLHWMARKASLDGPTSVELLCGTTERRARIAPIGEKPIAPGDRAFARIHVDEAPLALLPGDRFVLRGFSREAGVGATLGGGIVLDVAPPHRRRRDSGLRRDLERLAQGGIKDEVAVRVERAGLRGIELGALAQETGRSNAQLEEALEELVRTGAVSRVDATLCLSAQAVDRLEGELLAALDRFHENDPLQAGMPRASLLGTLPANVSGDAGAFLMKRLVDRGEILRKGETISRSSFESTLDADQSHLADALRSRLESAGLEAPTLRSLAEELEEDPAGLRHLGHYLERQGVVVAAPDDLFFDRTSVLALIDKVLAHFGEHDELDTQTLKALIGTSRRTAMPLMALLDDLQITRRDGSIRRLMQREPRW